MEVLFMLLIMLLFGLLGLAATAFWIWEIIEVATKETNEGNQKLIWLLIIIFVHVLGAVIYFFVRRPQRIKELGM